MFTPRTGFSSSEIGKGKSWWGKQQASSAESGSGNNSNEAADAQVFFREDEIVEKRKSLSQKSLVEDDASRDSWVAALAEMRSTEIDDKEAWGRESQIVRPSSVFSSVDMDHEDGDQEQELEVNQTKRGGGGGGGGEEEGEATNSNPISLENRNRVTPCSQSIDDSDQVDRDTIILDMFGVDDSEFAEQVSVESSPTEDVGTIQEKPKRATGLFQRRRPTLRFSARVGANFFRDRFSSKKRKANDKNNGVLSAYEAAPAVVPTTGDETPTAIYVVPSTTTEAINASSLRTNDEPIKEIPAKTSDEKIKIQPDASDIDEKVYGAAVSLLMRGTSKRKLPEALERQGYSPSVIQRVTKDFARLIPGSPTGHEDLPTTSSSLESTTTPNTNAAKKTSEPPSERTAPFYKMLKMGVPPPAVELKMKAEGLSRQEIRAVLTGNNADDTSTETKTSDTTATKKKEDIVVPKKPSEDPILAPYVRMLKVGVAMENVLQRIRLDDVTPEAVRRFRIAYNLEADDEEPPAESKKNENASERPSVMGLHWEKIACDTQVKKSVWAGSSSRNELDNEDMAHLKELFASGPSVDNGNDTKKTPPLKRAATAPATQRQKTVALLEKKRFQNMTIALSKFARQFRQDFAALWLAVEEMSADLDTDALDRLRETLPTSEETAKVVAYVKDAGPDKSDQLLAEKRLGLAERFVLATSRAPDYMTHLNAATELRSFGARADAINQAAESISLAATAIVSSQGLALCLQRILAVGNVMNAGTRRGEAQGVRLGSLLTIIKTKGRDRKTTVLDYVINGLLKRGHSEALDEVASSIIEPVATAAKLSVAEIERDMAALERGLSLVIKVEEAQREITQKTLFAVGKAEGDAMARHDARSFVFLPASYRRPEFPCSTARSAALGRRAARLDSFIADAQNSIAWLRHNRTTVMKVQTQALCEYFGEDPSTYRNAGTILDTAHTLLRAFNASYKAIIQQSITEKKLEERRRRSAKMLERRTPSRDLIMDKTSHNGKTRPSSTTSLRPTRGRISSASHNTTDDTVVSRQQPSASADIAAATSSGSATGRDLLLKAKSRQSRQQPQRISSTSRRTTSSKPQPKSRSPPPVPDAWSAVTEATAETSVPDAWASILPSS